MTARPSELIFARLKENAKELSRPAIRLASIERLKEACDAIEGGGAAEIDKRLAGHVSITPSMIERYVKARAKSGAREWTGPTRVFIAQDPDLKAYVETREDERLKVFGTAKKLSSRRKDIEDAISRLPIEIRQILRHDLEEGRIAKKRLDLLSRGLRSMPEVDVDALLNGGSTSSLQIIATSGHCQEQAKDGPVLAMDDCETLQRLWSRLSDHEEMKRAGLEVDGSRLRMTTPPKTTIVRPEEMTLLHRLGHFKG